MQSTKFTFPQIFARKAFLLYLLLLITGISLAGWLSGIKTLSSFSSAFIPIAPSTSVTFIILSIHFLLFIRYEKTRNYESGLTSLVVIVGLFCLLLFFDYLFNFRWDIENIFIKNPFMFGRVTAGRMSPITALLFILICISLLSVRKNNPDWIKYIGGSFSLLVFLMSSVLLIGYMYKVPILYGSNIIPVSLPTSICFFLFSTTLIRFNESRFWTFNLITDNNITRQLLRSFLPVVVVIVIFQDYLIANLSFHLKNPTLSIAVILLVSIPVTIFLLTRVSANIGTQLLRAEQQLKESEEKFRSTMENSADAIFITNQKGQYVYTNKAVTEMLGYTYEEMMKKTITDLCPADEIDDYLNMFGQILTEGKVFTEIELLKKEGNYISTDLNAVLLPDGMVYGSCRDISDRKKAEKDLAESLQFNAQIINSIQEGIIVYDSTLHYKVWNPFMEKLSGIPASRVLGKYPTELFPFLEAAGVIENLKRTLNGEIIGAVDFPFKVPDSDKSGWTSDRNIPFRDVNGEIIGIIGTVYDITDRKRAEQIIKENEVKMIRLNADKDRFISILGHDLKSPFNSILGLSELLARDIEKFSAEEIEDLANNLYNSAKNTNRLLDDILIWARTQQGEITFKPKILNFSELCGSIIEILNPGAQAKSITINYYGDAGIEVYADIDMLKTIVLNLVSNAIKFTNTGGTINIKAEKFPENVTISVSDNGVGISRKDLVKLFDISQVISTPGTAKETGTGLGLLLCKEFVEKHGGKIWVESEEGKGSDFKFSLPALF